jgi:hypothetical protein
MNRFVDGDIAMGSRVANSTGWNLSGITRRHASDPRLVAIDHGASWNNGPPDRRTIKGCGPP